MLDSSGSDTSNDSVQLTDTAPNSDTAEPLDTANPPRTDTMAGPSGAWDNPIVVDSFPFQHAGNTSAAPAQLADSYAPCAPDTDESGGEFVYRLDIGEAGELTVTVDDKSGDSVDVDVHVLTGPSADTCVARHNVTVSVSVEPGTYWVTVDTWVNGNGEVQAGPFVVTMDLKPPGAPNQCLVSPIQCTDGDVPPTGALPVEAVGDSGCPAGMVGINDYCVDRYEAALVWTPANSPETLWSPYLNPDGQPVRAVSAAGLIPQGYVNQLQAGAACTAAGKRLCTHPEWLRACQGSATSTYPYGNVYLPGACNDHRDCHPVVQFFESAADWVWSKLGDSCINQLPDGLALTGTYAQCVSTDGALDLAGNLHEWTADPTGVFRGGFYVDATTNGHGCLYKTTAHNVYHWDYSTGFRCCADRDQ